MPDNTDGSIVALLPSASDPITAASSEPAHITMAWLGDAVDLSTESIATIREAIVAYAAEADGPITASVGERGTLGDDKADVVFVEGDGLAAYREGLVALAPVAEAVAAVEQHPEWTPHVTLGYPETPAKTDYAGTEVVFDRLVLWVGEEQEEFTLGGPVDMEDPAVDPDADPEEEIPEDEMMAGLDEMGGDPIPWHGVLMPLDTLSGDNRMISGPVTTRNLPLPLKWMKQDGQGHDQSVVVANIEGVKVEGGMLLGWGTFASTPEAAEVLGLRIEGMLRGVSVDLDQGTSVIEYEDGTPVDLNSEIDPEAKIIEHISEVRLAAATIVSIPAFQEAYFDLGTWEETIAAAGDCEDCDVLTAAFHGDEYCLEDCGEKATVEVTLSADTTGCFCEKHADEAVEKLSQGMTFAPGTRDGPGWITNPKATSRIRTYWVRGKGAAKIRWGQGGDFNRCRKQLVKYVQNPEWLAGLCANMHKEALGFWPGNHSQEEAVTASGEMAPAFTMVDVDDAITAGAGRKPKEWFENPNLENLTALTVSDDGRVFGHAAGWGQCHIARSDRCVTAPKSSTDYAYFHVGAVRTDDGDVPVGHITMGTGHAALDLKSATAAAHYDNTGTVVADIHAGEDAHGIWVAGALREDLTEKQVHAIRASAISGDWRRIGAGMEMVAALAVNVPGFPIPRTAIRASGMMDEAMVAAAVVLQTDSEESTMLKQFAKDVIREVREEDKRVEHLSTTRVKIAAENAKRAADVRARVEALESTE